MFGNATGQCSIVSYVSDTRLTTNPGLASSIPTRSHTFVVIDHEILSTAILLPSAKGCCQLQATVIHEVLVNRLVKLGKKKVWLGELSVLIWP